MRVISIDPGETTAFMTATIRPNDFVPLTPTVAVPLQYPDVQQQIHANVRPQRDWSGGRKNMNTSFVDCDLTVNKMGHWHGIGEMAEAEERGVFAGANVFVIEDYRIYPNRANKHIGSQVYTAKEIGRIEWVAFRQNLTASNRGIVLQAASMAKQWWPNKRVKDHIRNYMPEPTVARILGVRGKHAIDAFRHLLTFFERNGGTVV